jgi:hypothetical protein
VFTDIMRSQDYVDLGGPCYWSEGLIGLLQLPRSELERYHDVHQRLQQVGLLVPDCPSPIPGCLALVEATALPEDTSPGPLSPAAVAASERLQPELRLKLIAKLHADEAAGSRTAIFQDGSWVPVDSISNAVLEQLPAVTRTAVLQEFGSSLGATPLPVLYTYAQVGVLFLCAHFSYQSHQQQHECTIALHHLNTHMLCIPCYHNQLKTQPIITPTYCHTTQRSPHHPPPGAQGGGPPAAGQGPAAICGAA